MDPFAILCCNEAAPHSFLCGADFCFCEKMKPGKIVVRLI